MHVSYLKTIQQDIAKKKKKLYEQHFLRYPFKVPLHNHILWAINLNELNANNIKNCHYLVKSHTNWLQWTLQPIKFTKKEFQKEETRTPILHSALSLNTSCYQNGRCDAHIAGWSMVILVQATRGAGPSIRTRC